MPRCYVVGFGLAFALNAAPLLITELAYPTQVCEIPVSFLTHSLILNDRFQRGKVTAVYNSCWYIGSIICEQVSQARRHYLIYNSVQLHGFVTLLIGKLVNLHGHGVCQPLPNASYL